MKKYFSTQDINIEDFKQITSSKTLKSDFPLCEDVQKNIPIYDVKKILSSKPKIPYQEEFNHILEQGPGVLVFKNMYQDLDLIDRKNKIFYQIAEKEANTTEKSDHFAPSDSNLRIWNSLEKSVLEDASSFIDYYKNPIIRLISKAWLGPYYQVTAQLNVVKPGGQAQNPHRDYHLGFQDNKTVSEFPLNVHLMSQMLTLQGAVAHSDMPVESGPTMLLPFSQKYPLGYLAYRDKTFQDFFYEKQVQLPLSKGDGLFFNPALFHGAGNNKTKNIDRMANLLQISSVFGKTMEKLDFDSMISRIYQPLLEKYNQKQITTEELENVCLCICDNYAFPTNLDKDLPEYGLAPHSIFHLTLQSIKDNLFYDDFKQKLENKWKQKQS